MSGGERSGRVDVASFEVRKTHSSTTVKGVLASSMQLRRYMMVVRDRSLGPKGKKRFSSSK